VIVDVGTYKMPYKAVKGIPTSGAKVSNKIALAATAPAVRTVPRANDVSCSRIKLGPI